MDTSDLLTIFLIGIIIVLLLVLILKNFCKNSVSLTKKKEEWNYPDHLDCLGKVKLSIFGHDIINLKGYDETCCIHFPRQVPTANLPWTRDDGGRTKGQLYVSGKVSGMDLFSSGLVTDEHDFTLDLDLDNPIDETPFMGNQCKNLTCDKGGPYKIYCEIMVLDKYLVRNKGIMDLLGNLYYYLKFGDLVDLVYQLIKGMGGNGVKDLREKLIQLVDGYDVCCGTCTWDCLWNRCPDNNDPNKCPQDPNNPKNNAIFYACGDLFWGSDLGPAAGIVGDPVAGGSYLEWSNEQSNSHENRVHADGIDLLNRYNGSSLGKKGDGSNIKTIVNTVLLSNRVYMQGHFITDGGHGDDPLAKNKEIHPPDSIAYAWLPTNDNWARSPQCSCKCVYSGYPKTCSKCLPTNMQVLKDDLINLLGSVVNVPINNSEWFNLASNSLCWRMSGFTNSSLHRVISDCHPDLFPEINTPRTTVWEFPLPLNAYTYWVQQSCNAPCAGEFQGLCCNLTNQQKTGIYRDCTFTGLTLTITRKFCPLTANVDQPFTYYAKNLLSLKDCFNDPVKTNDFSIKTKTFRWTPENLANPNFNLGLSRDSKYNSGLPVLRVSFVMDKPNEMGGLFTLDYQINVSVGCSAGYQAQYLASTVPRWLTARTEKYSRMSRGNRNISKRNAFGNRSNIFGNRSNVFSNQNTYSSNKPVLIDNNKGDPFLLGQALLVFLANGPKTIKGLSDSEKKTVVDKLNKLLPNLSGKFLESARNVMKGITTNKITSKLPSISQNKITPYMRGLGPSFRR